jgi:hypothetical protein
LRQASSPGAIDFRHSTWGSFNTPKPMSDMSTCQYLVVSSGKTQLTPHTSVSDHFITLHFHSFLYSVTQQVATGQELCSKNYIWHWMCIYPFP